MRTTKTEMIENQSAGQGRPAQASTDSIMETPRQDSNRKLEFQTPHHGDVDTGSSGDQPWGLARNDAKAKENASKWRTQDVMSTMDYAKKNVGNDTPDADKTKKRREEMSQEMGQRNSRTPSRNTGDNNDDGSDDSGETDRKRKAKEANKKERGTKKTEMGDDIDELTKDNKRPESELAEAKKQILRNSRTMCSLWKQWQTKSKKEIKLLQTCNMGTRLRLMH